MKVARSVAERERQESIEIETEARSPSPLRGISHFVVDESSPQETLFATATQHLKDQSTRSRLFEPSNAASTPSSISSSTSTSTSTSTSLTLTQPHLVTITVTPPQISIPLHSSNLTSYSLPHTTNFPKLHTTTNTHTSPSHLDISPQLSVNSNPYLCSPSAANSSCFCSASIEVVSLRRENQYLRGLLHEIGKGLNNFLNLLLLAIILDCLAEIALEC